MTKRIRTLFMLLAILWGQPIQADSPFFTSTFTIQGSNPRPIRAVYRGGKTYLEVNALAAALKLPISVSPDSSVVYIGGKSSRKVLYARSELKLYVDAADMASQLGYKADQGNGAAVDFTPDPDKKNEPVASKTPASNLPAQARGVDRESWSNFMTAIRLQGMEVLAESDPQSQRVSKIGMTVAQPSKRPVTWCFFVVKSADPNAACTGEGVAFVTTGLLDIGLDDDELAGVLAHEVAHGARHHLDDDKLEVQRLVRALKNYDSARGGSKWRAKEELKDQILRSQSYFSHQTEFSHLHEKEADSFGTRFATEAGYKADGIIRALEKLLSHNLLQYGAKAMLSSKTHPPLPVRIKRLKENLAR